MKINQFFLTKQCQMFETKLLGLLFCDLHLTSRTPCTSFCCVESHGSLKSLRETGPTNLCYVTNDFKMKLVKTTVH